MKEKIIKPLAVALCASILAGGVGAAVYAASFGVNGDKKEQSQSVTAVAAGTEDAGIAKDETVYVLAGADGRVRKIIVSDWIKNSIGSDKIADESELENVENVKGDETYTMNGDNMRVWDADGGDIYCQGSIEKELPVEIAVSYKLDGKSISPDELAGKSGRVTIRFDYKNNQSEMVEIDGRKEKIYVPFVMLTGILLDGDVFTNVDVSNGKLINDGDRTAVVGIAFPGLQSNLNVDADKFEIPDYVEITADAERFEMTNTVTIATNEVFSSLDTEKLSLTDDLTDSLDELEDAMNQLIDGSSNLYEGICTLLDKSGELAAGIEQLAAGAEKLKSGAGDLDDGASELADGAAELAGGLDKIASNNDALKNGSRQVFDSLLSAAGTQLEAAGIAVPELTVGNYAEVLEGVIASLDAESVKEKAQAAALESVTSAVNAQKETVKAAVTAKIREEVDKKVSEAVRDGVEEQVLAAMNLTKEAYEAGVAAGQITSEQQDQITAAVSAQMESDAVKAAISANADEQMRSVEITSMIDSNTSEQIETLIKQSMDSTEVQGQISAAIAAAESGAASIGALKEQLDSYNKFYSGLSEYTDGVAAAKKGADALKNGAAALKYGTAELYNGISELCGGIITLKDGVPALVDGVTELRDGAMKLSEGLREFDEMGVKKLINAVDGDLGGLLARIRATADVSKDYRSFSGISDGMDGQVKFIYRTDSVRDAG